jgi:hypothetical protein
MSAAKAVLAEHATANIVARNFLFIAAPIFYRGAQGRARQNPQDLSVFVTFRNRLT